MGLYQMMRRSARATSTSAAIRCGFVCGGSLIQAVSTITCSSADSSSGRVGNVFRKYALRNIGANCQGRTPRGAAVRHAARFERRRLQTASRGNAANEGIAGEAA